MEVIALTDDVRNGFKKTSEISNALSDVRLTANELFCQAKQIIHWGINVGNNTQHEECMIAGFSVGFCPLTGYWRLGMVNGDTFALGQKQIFK